MEASGSDYALAAWRSLMRLLGRSRMALGRKLRPFGIRPGQAWLIRLVGEAGDEGLKLNELSKRMQVTSANITGLMDRVEHDGYVQRRPDPKDRRVVRAVLTPKGRELLEKLKPVYQAWVERCMSCLTPEEQVELAGLLSRLADHIAELAEEEDGPQQ